MSSASLYGLGASGTSLAAVGALPFVSAVAPSASNVSGPSGPFQIGQVWIDRTAAQAYTLTSLATSNGVVTATWSTTTGTTGVTSIAGNSGSASPSAGVVTVSGGSTGLTTSGSGSTLSLGGTLNPASGGTGATTYTTDGVVYYTGTVLASTSAGTAGQALVSNGAGVAPTYNNTAKLQRPIVTQTATYQLALTDEWTFQYLTNAGAAVITVPPVATVAWTVGAEIDFFGSGAGTVTFLAGAGVTIHSVAGELALSAQYTGASLKMVATDTWILVGNLA